MLVCVTCTKNCIPIHFRFVWKMRLKTCQFTIIREKFFHYLFFIPSDFSICLSVQNKTVLCIICYFFKNYRMIKILLIQFVDNKLNMILIFWPKPTLNTYFLIWPDYYFLLSNLDDKSTVKCEVTTWKYIPKSIKR